jgi:hypothetical protein
MSALFVISQLKKYNISNHKLSGLVEVDHHGIVAHSAPIFRVFIGQHSNRVVRWMDKMGKTRSVFVPNTQYEFAFQEAQ